MCVGVFGNANKRSLSDFLGARHYQLLGPDLRDVLSCETIFAFSSGACDVQPEVRSNDFIPPGDLRQIE